MDAAQLRLYSGHLNSLSDIPTEQSNQIKVFLSCNLPGEEFREERNAILSRVIPPLREETKAKYGLELHHVDLMFGADGDVGGIVDSYEAREFRLKELLRAQKLSAGPCFMVLIGQKYGKRPVPQLVLSEIFELIQTALLNSNGRRARAFNLLDKWYIKDENSIPAVHVLRPVVESDGDDWSEDRDSLWNVLMYGVELCCREGSLPPEAMRTYFASELENEVKHGLMHGSERGGFVVERKITDLANYAGERQAQVFTETEWNEVEERAQLCTGSMQLLQSLKTDVIQANLPDECISRYSILWRYDSGIDSQFHKEYIDELCNDLTTKLRDQISEAAAAAEARKVYRSRLHEEVIAHWRKAIDRGRACEGRDNEQENLLNYLKDERNTEFYTIYGESGSGKTCILSSLFLEMKNLLPQSTIAVIRFIGLTHESANLRDLLQSICQQILTCLNRDISVPMDFPEVLKFFSALLHEIPSSIQLVLLLDSLNSLLPDFNSHLLQWLPSSLPKNVRIIVSCQPHAHGMFTRLKTELITKHHENFTEVKPLGQEVAMMLTLRWLQQESMCITNEQAEQIKAAFNKCSLPLYIKFLFNRIRKWRSFDLIDSKVLGTSCSTFLDALFEEFELKYGKVLVKHSVSYLTASKTGLSDMEMEDLLSLDEHVMEHVHCKSEPVVRRCPPKVWAQLRDELDFMLNLKVADDYDVYYWNHAIIREYTENRYLANDSFRKKIHCTIADYYLGNWFQKPMKYKNLNGEEKLVERYVLSQPLTYTSAGGKTDYNQRKYDQVPRHLYLANRLDELNAKVMFNYDWLYNKIKALSLQKILADLSLNPGTEATLLESALRSAQGLIEKNIDSLPVELSGRLLPYYHTYPNLRSLIDQCGTAGLSHCAIVPLFNYHQVPGSPLQYTFEYTDQIDSLLVTQDGRYVFTKSDNSQVLRKFDLLSGEIQADIATSYGKAYLSPDDCYLVIVDNEIEKAVKVHNAMTGNYIFQLIPINLIGMNEQRKYHLGPISVSSKFIATLITTEATHLCIGCFEDQDIVKLVNLGGKGSIVRISPNQDYVLCNVGSNVLTYSLQTYEQVCLTPLEYRPTCHAINKSSSKVLLTDEFSHIITVIHMSTQGHTQMVSKISLQPFLKGDRVLQISLADDDNSLLIRAEHNVLSYNTFTDKLTLHVKRPVSVMREFRLPKHSKPTSIIYTDAIISHDNDVLMTSLFRNIQFWNLKTGKPMETTILAPVGIITKVIQSRFQSQILTVQQDAQCVQVWNLKDYVMDVTTLDRLTSPIDRLILTEDNFFCFATGCESDEIGVIDMRTGLLVNLLTHESEVVDITPTCDGSFVFVAVNPSKTEFCNKIWSVNDRKIVKEFGQVLGHTVAVRKSKTIIHIAQASTMYQAPFTITIFNFSSGTCEEFTYDFIINHAISKPFVTYDDTYMALLTADQYLEKEACYNNPAVCAFYLKGRYMHSIIGKNELSPFLDNRHIIALVPIPMNSTEIIAIYQVKISGCKQSSGYGFVSVDLAMGTILRYSDNFMPSTTDLNALYLTNDGSLCVNANLGMIFAMNSGKRVGTIGNRMSKLALLKNGEVAAYYRGSHLIVERIEDNRILGECDVHVDICHIKASNDDKTIMIGCVDGTVLGYVIIDPEKDEINRLILAIASRQVVEDEPPETKEVVKARRPHTATWDRTNSSAVTVRPLTARNQKFGSSSDREILTKIRPVYRTVSAVKTARNNSGVHRLTSSYEKSRTCSVM